MAVAGYVIYNPLAGTGKDIDEISLLDLYFQEELKYYRVDEVDYKRLFNVLSDDDYVVLCGGDGTLNRFINDLDGIDIGNEIYYYPIGSGNDFAADFGKEKGCNPFSIREYLNDLPTVTVNDNTYRFLNGVGYGIDGYCCAVGDRLRSKKNKSINYTSIAIKGLLRHYRPTCATVCVDGKRYKYNNVWLAPTMHGMHYGGGMVPAPDQTRGSGSLSVMIFCGKSRLKTLCIFPSIFKGRHIKHKNSVKVHSGKSISVSFDRPTPLQIDGETILNVTEYTARI